MLLKKFPVQKRVRIIAFVDIILSAASIGTSISDLQHYNEEGEGTHAEEIARTGRTIVVLYITISLSIVKLVMGFLLLRGAEKNIIKHCKQWLIATIFLWLLQVVSFMVDLTVGNFSTLTTVFQSIAITLRMVQMYAVTNFIRMSGKGEITVDEPLPTSKVTSYS